ncbi:hypothetical protein MMC07_006483 [Pseudocyphellaria aurata]|nr:hypothetical protein [Pseudocyphellaria aurata]
MSILTYVAVVALALVLALYNYVRIPGNMPKNIPSVPIYISLIGLWSAMGQDEIYDRWLRQPLEKYGAVKIWFAGRWNVLVTRPDLLTDMMRNEDIYAKAGSQKKIPWSVISSLVGDNIINSHGDDWKLYTSVMKPGMQKTNFDSRPLLEKSRVFVGLLLKEQDEAGQTGSVLVNPLIQRFAIAAMGESFLDIDFQCLEKPGMRIEVLQSIIKRTIFKPLFFNFPALDRYPMIFPSRRRAFEIMKEFEDLLFTLVKNRPRKFSNKEPVEPKDELLIHMMERALEQGKIDETQFRANLKITFLTAHENTQQLLNSMFWQLGKDQTVQDKLRAEVLGTRTVNPTSEVLNSLPYLTSVICELLRVYPPVSQLINRVALKTARLGGVIEIPKGTFVGWNAPAVQSNEQVWGPTARQFIPERWGDQPDEIMAKSRRETVKGNYIAFNSHTRKCLGQGYALLEMKMVLFELVRRVKWSVDPEYKLKLTSGGILAPLMCRVNLQKLDDQTDDGKER